MRKNTFHSAPAALPGAAALASILVAQAAFGQTAPSDSSSGSATPPAGSSDSTAPADAPAAPAASAETAPAATEPAPAGAEPATAPASTTGASAAPAAGAGASVGAGASAAPGGGFGLSEPAGAMPAASAGPAAAKPQVKSEFFAEDWWAHTRPTLELHGNFRVRSDLFSHFELGRIDTPENSLWPHAADDYYQDENGVYHGPQVCTPAEAGSGTSASPADATVGCVNSTQAGANMRFRVEPAIIISDNLRIRSQIDLLDNLVLGSTAQGYSNFASATGYSVGQRSGYYPVSGTSWTQSSPVSGVNSLSDAVAVKRAWAEYETPVGQVKFGRMPDHFGLGLLHNGGDDIDGDNQSTVDRIAFTTGLPSLGLHVMGAWDFPWEGPTSARFVQEGRPAYDVAQYDDVTAMNLVLMRKIDPQLERRMLAHDEVVVNAGLYVTYAFQKIANDMSGTCNNGAAALDCTAGQVSSGYVRRGMDLWTPDLYAELKYQKFRFGAEVVTHQGTFESLATEKGDNNYSNTTPGGADGWRINQWGFAGEMSQLLVEDKLRIALNFGYATGDADVDGLIPGSDGMQTQVGGDRTVSTFRFHPGYRVDMILHRHLLSRVQGTYYVKPSVQYDFIRQPAGMKLGGRADAIWTRASQFMQTPGHQPDLGIELNATAYYQAKDGFLNDTPDVLGGFFAMLQYGVLFPLGGLGYLSEQQTSSGGAMPALQTAQNVRLFLGVAY